MHYIASFLPYQQQKFIFVITGLFFNKTIVFLMEKKKGL